MRLCSIAHVLAISCCVGPSSFAAQVAQQLVPIPQARQPGQSTGKRYPVSGVVFNVVTNEPVRRALVRVNSGQEQYAAFSGADGRFQMAGVLEGTAFVTAQRPGYFDSSSLANTHFFRPNFGHQVGPGTNDFRIALTPEAKVTGTVLDEEGEPIQGLAIQLIGQQIVDGRKQWVNRGGASTDEDGSYRIDEQMPGPIAVCTAGQAPAHVGDAGVYPPRCYPNSPDQASAQILELLPGQEARADFKLSEVRGFTISGTVSGMPSGQAPGLWAEGPDGTQLSVGAIQVNSSNGRFVIRDVPNGSWKFHFQSNSGQGTILEALQDIAVNGANVQGVQVTLQPGVDIPVEVNKGGVGPDTSESAAMITNGSQPNPQPNNNFVQVHLYPTDNDATRKYYSSPVPNARGEMTVPPRIAVLGVVPGKYNVKVQAPGDGCVGSILSGGAYITREPLIVEAGSAPPDITVTLRRDCASLEISAHSDLRNAGGVLLLIPETGISDPQILSIQANASLTIGNLSPGSYRVYAVSDLDGLEYANPQAMRDLPSQSITLAPNQKTAVTLDIVQRSGP